MAAEFITPTDPQSGLVLPVAPRCEWLPLNNPEVADVHHNVHPRNHPGLKTLAGFALRNSQLQITERTLHNEGPLRYHRWWAGPEIPDDERIIFQRCLWASAGVIPRRVIDLTSRSAPFERDATRKEMEFLHTPNEDDPFGYRYIRYRYEPIRDFMRHFAAKQNLWHLSPSRIDEFLHTKDMDQKLRLGKFLLANAAAVASDGMRERWHLLRRRKMIHPAMPAEPQTLVYYKLGLRVIEGETQPRAFEPLERHLLAQAA
jgi:hypothetical protein